MIDWCDLIRWSDESIMYYKLKNVAKARVELLLSCLFLMYAKKFNSTLLVAAVAAAAQRNGMVMMREQWPSPACWRCRDCTGDLKVEGFRCEQEKMNSDAMPNIDDELMTQEQALRR